MLPNLKNIIIFGVIATLLVLGYLFFFNDSGEEAGLVSSGATLPGGINPVDVPAITQDFLTILLNIKSIRLDDNIFKDAAFLSLKDSSILLNPEGNEGRPNPFAPIGSDPTFTPTNPNPNPTTTPTDPAMTTPPPVMPMNPSSSSSTTTNTTTTTPPPASSTTPPASSSSSSSSSSTTTPPASAMPGTENSGATPN